MLYRKIARMEEYDFSLLGFGCWALGSSSGWSTSSDEISIKIVDQAIEQGVTLFDTAPVYGFGTSEMLLGKIIKGKRDKIILASKCGLVWDNNKNIQNDLSESSVLNEIDVSLKRLNVDYIDIYQLHWPDPKVAIEDLQNTIEKLLNSQKIKYIGLSNFSLDDCKVLAQNPKVVSYQGLYNLFETNEKGYHGINLEYQMKDEILPFCRENNLAVLPYSPLMQGILTDNFDASRIGANDVRHANPKFHADNIQVYLDKREKLLEYAKSIDMSLLNIAYGWLGYQEAITSVISGSTKEYQLTKNIEASNTVLSKEQYDKVEEIINS